MNIEDKDVYVCPQIHKTMTCDIYTQDGDNVISGKFVSPNGNEYKIFDGVPDLTYPFKIPTSDAESTNWYEQNADVYDEYLPLTFKTFDDNEIQVRNSMIDKLNLKPGHKVLELGAGTGRDSVLIAERLSNNGELYLQDLCKDIFVKCFDKMKGCQVPVKFYIGNACYLPFPDDYFDASFHFGGLNTFSNKQRFFDEITRVTKLGGKIVAGDESMPEWLRDTEFGKILMNSNPHYKYKLPLKYIPVSSRNVKIEWIIGGVFYIIDYVVGLGEPQADFDFTIPGLRGGTHRTRYYGHIEGITEETIMLAKKAREISGKSMHEWLDDVIKHAASLQIDNKVMNS